MGAISETAGRSAGTMNTRHWAWSRGRDVVVSAVSPMMQRCSSISVRVSAGTERPSKEECSRHSSTTPLAVQGRCLAGAWAREKGKYNFNLNGTNYTK